MRTLGIDLSAQTRNTVACLVEWHEGRAAVRVVEPKQSNRDLVTRMRAADVVGLDAPFGWPDEFVAAMRTWSGEGTWGPAWHDTEGCPRLRLRRTDEWVWHEVGKQPLSVSSDRIGITAWRAAALLAELEGGQPVDRVQGRVREVYPGATLLRWGFLERREPMSYKRDAQRRGRILDAMEVGGWLDLGTARAALMASDHALDALVGALTARSVAAGLATPPPPSIPTDVIAREGWIWLPAEGSWERLPNG